MIEYEIEGNDYYNTEDINKKNKNKNEQNIKRRESLDNT